MNNIEAMRLALDALENPWKSGADGVADAITALRQALRKALDHVPDTTKMTEPDMGIDRGAWSDVPDATKWVDELRGGDETEEEEEPVAWMDVVGYEDKYEVSSLGDIRNKKTGKILSKSLMGAGYIKADLWDGNRRWQTSAHRIVAAAFIDNPEDLKEVNHINGIKTDNRASNLEWVSRSDNVNHSYYELGNQIKPVIATNIKTREAIYYPSINAAERDGFHSAHIINVIKGNRLHHKGFTFDYHTAPPKREWVGLTDEEILEAAGIDGADTWVFETAYAIEAKLKEKNNG